MSEVPACTCKCSGESFSQAAEHALEGVTARAPGTQSELATLCAARAQLRDFRPALSVVAALFARVSVSDGLINTQP